MTVDNIASKLQKLLEGTMTNIESSEVFKAVFHGNNPQLTFLVLRNVLLEVSYYAPHLVQSSFLAIGRFPRTKPQLTRSVVDLVLDELTHGDMAKADFLKMKGEPSRLNSSRLSVQSLVLTSTVQRLADQESPYCILGFLYLIESMTAKIAPMMLKLLEAFGAKSTSSKFVDVHAKEEEHHAASILSVIEELCASFLSSEEEVLYGYRCVASVFPMPIWNAGNCSQGGGWIGVSGQECRLDLTCVFSGIR